MLYTLRYKFKFDSAHFLPKTNSLVSKKCLNVHGHTWEGCISIYCRNLQDGMVIDFLLLKRLIETYDHRDLNTIITNPTAENIAHQIYEDVCLMLKERKIDLARMTVELRESPDSIIIYG